MSRRAGALLVGGVTLATWSRPARAYDGQWHDELAVLGSLRDNAHVPLACGVTTMVGVRQERSEWWTLGARVQASYLTLPAGDGGGAGSAVDVGASVTGAIVFRLSRRHSWELGIALGGGVGRSSRVIDASGTGLSSRRGYLLFGMETGATWHLARSWNVGLMAAMQVSTAGLDGWFGPTLAYVWGR